MAKKKKEICPYCSKSFAYLSRHKCKIKERVEGIVDDKSEAERRIERIEEKRKTVKRSLRKDEKAVLAIINEEEEILFDALMEITKKERNNLELIIEILSLKSFIKFRRELIEAAWTKRIFSIKDYKDVIDVADMQTNTDDKSFMWNIFSRSPCFRCIFHERCKVDNPNNFNPYHCSYLTSWIETSIKGEKFDIDFLVIKEAFDKMT